MALQGGIFIVIYADVLFIINFFLTLLLLEITAKLGKKSPKTMRIVLASVLGGAYSMIILVKDMEIWISVLLKIIFAILLILCTFGFLRIKSFISLILMFLFSNFAFLGIITGIQMLFFKNRISINNGEIYFDIGAKQLLVCAFLSYLISLLIVRIHNRRLSSGEMFNIIIENNSKSVSLFAFSDTGNKLREPFSGFPVIIVRKNSVEGLFDERKARLIPASTVNSSSYLLAFKPDKVTVKTSKGNEKIENVYIALSDDINSKSFSAIINPEIICV